MAVVAEEVNSNIKVILLNDIRLSDRKRSLDENKAQSIADSIKLIGLLNPITVREDLTLIAGRHRLRAFEILGKEYIPASVITLQGLEAELAEIDENLIRNELTVLQESIHLARRKEIYEALWPETKKGSAGGRAKNNVQNDNLSLSTFTEDTAAKTGESKRTIERRTKIGSELADLEKEIEGTDIEDNQSQLLALTKIENPEERKEVINRIKSGEAKNVPQARRKIKEEANSKKEITIDEDFFKVIVGDAVSVIETLEESPASVICDPPYGLDTHRTRQGGQDYADGEDYALTLLNSVAGALSKKCAQDAHLYFFSGYSYVWQFKQILEKYFDVQDNPIIWVKDNHTMCDFEAKYPNKHEYIIFCKMPGSKRKLSKCMPDVITEKRSRETTHSAEKPVDLLKKFIEQSTDPGELILDPFAGSGSTGVAAHELNRRFIGVEIDQRWADVARSRI